MTCIARRVSKVELSQWLDILGMRPVVVLDSSEDLQIRSRSWKDNSHS